MTVIEIPSGKALATVPIGAGVDAVTYDAGTGLIICSNGDGTATIIHQDNANQYAVIKRSIRSGEQKRMPLIIRPKRFISVPLICSQTIRHAFPIVLKCWFTK